MGSNSNKKGMEIRYPATRWQDAIPTGSGIVGALVYGNIIEEKIVLNHSALYYPSDNSVVVDVSDGLPEMRRLIYGGECRKAAMHLRKIYDERAGVQVESEDPYQPFCSIDLQMPTDGPFKNYLRSVDYETGKVNVEWTDNSATLKRELFVSRESDTVCLKVSSSKAAGVSCKLDLVETRNEQKDSASICHSFSGEFKSDISTQVNIIDQSLTFKGEFPGSIEFGALGKVSAVGGKISIEEDKLCIENADSFELQVKLFVNEGHECGFARLQKAFADEKTSFDQAFAIHQELHAALFKKVSLNLGGEHQSNEELLMDAYVGDVPLALTQKMFDYGRYLLISSSRAGGLPANLQGLWNGDYRPAWFSDIHTDENIQMNYWLAMPSGLGESALPLFDYFEKYIDQFRENAKNNYGCRGILLPMGMTTKGYTNPNEYAYWTAGAGWIAQHFYDYYLFTGDLKFLENRAVPWLKEVAHFYEDFLECGEDGKVHFAPSISPENRPSNGNSLVSIDATMDVAICKEVLSNLCDACELLNIEVEGVQKWKSILNKLPTYGINEDGAMREWIHPDFDDHYHHRHQSQVYPVFPGFEVTKESAPDIFNACRVAVEKRLVIGLTSQTGWSMAHMANIYARLGLGDRALECLDILSRSSTGPNLFTYHNDWRSMGLSSRGDSLPPFQIDANFGITAAVLEMLVFSKPGEIKLLPALPQKWNQGSIKGLCCRGGLTVSIDWNREKNELNAVLKSKADTKIDLFLPKFVKKLNISSEKVVDKNTFLGVDLKAGVEIQIRTS